MNTAQVHFGSLVGHLSRREAALELESNIEAGDNTEAGLLAAADNTDTAEDTAAACVPPETGD